MKPAIHAACRRFALPAALAVLSATPATAMPLGGRADVAYSGVPKALEIMKVAKKNSYNIQMNRFAKVLGFEMKDGIPKPLLDMPRESLINLANDGVWFQAVENTRDMYDAKRCNDSCWTRFAPFEAWSIKQFLGLPEQAGIEGLKKALRFRMYARINVQSARKRQGLEDYPCKSAGLVEYRHFGETIDSRIRCECVGCPPDQHPAEWFCAWRYTIS